ncbi:hypothetical protein NYE39_09460 [Janibacter sp. FSL W8-0316]|uniref:hypothetical protein n=1 Tax=Janibacter sp. FSL W8-0316 TaxID=2975325 RepID=UPI0030FABFA1
MRLEDAVDELYAAAPADFVATRTRLAREAKGDDPDLAAAITALRKPTRTAWLLNRVARDEPQVVADLTALGERMRAAQAKGDGATLAQARPERRAAIDALVAAAGRCAEATGSPFGAAARSEVDATAVAVLADEQSGRALASGTLLRALTYAGFGEVELDDAVATPLRLLPPLPDDAGDGAADPEVDAQERARQAALDSARDELREAERELSAARLEESQVRAALVVARDRVNTAEARVTRVTQDIADLGTRPVR